MDWNERLAALGFDWVSPPIHAELGNGEAEQVGTMVKNVDGETFYAVFHRESWCIDCFKTHPVEHLCVETFPSELDRMMKFFSKTYEEL
jgi:hypothetical protein